MIKFEDVTLIDNYRLINEKVHFIKSNVTLSDKSIHLIKGDNSKYLFGKLLMGFITPSFGKISVDNFQFMHNRIPKNLKAYRKKIGYLPYDFDNKFNFKSVNNNLKEMLYNLNYNINQADKKCEKVLEQVGLFGDYKVAKLSDLNSINKYRLYLASILIHDPDIVILERYINDIDIKNAIDNLAHKEGKTVIVVGNYKLNADNEFIISNNEFKEVDYEN